MRRISIGPPRDKNSPLTSHPRRSSLPSVLPIDKSLRRSQQFTQNGLPEDHSSVLESSPTTPKIPLPKVRRLNEG